MAIYKEILRKPRLIEAVEWTGNNLEEIKEFLGKAFIEYDRENNQIVFVDSLWSETEFTAEVGNVIYDEYGDFEVTSKYWFMKNWEEDNSDEFTRDLERNLELGRR